MTSALPAAVFSWVFQDETSEEPGWDGVGDPSVDIHTKCFRSARDDGRWHAGCDLKVDHGTPILAVSYGKVLQFAPFYMGTWDLVVGHEPEGYPPFTIRYGEVDKDCSLSPGDIVEAGEEIARVGLMTNKKQSHMLHFELYAGVDSQKALSTPRPRKNPVSCSPAERAAMLSRGWHPNFQRRLDLCNPVSFLKAIKVGTSPPTPKAWVFAASLQALVSSNETVRALGSNGPIQWALPGVFEGDGTAPTNCSWSLKRSLMHVWGSEIESDPSDRPR
jgi:Peptidase family M23